MKLMIRFSGDLDFFLQDKNQGRRFAWPLNRKASVKDIIESLGVPHTEIGTIAYEGKRVRFSFVPEISGSLDISGVTPPMDVCRPSFLRPFSLEKVKFVADVNVMKLGKLLLLLGFDVVCSSFFSDPEIADLAARENRIVLTRDTGLLNRKKIVFGRRIRSNSPYDQLMETLIFFGIKNEIRFFSRCSHCNKRLEPVEKDAVIHLLEPKTKKYFFKFFQCPECKKVFWKGSHYDRIAGVLKQLGVLIEDV